MADSLTIPHVMDPNARPSGQPISPGTQRRKEVNQMRTKKKVRLNESARRREAKFWAMMRSADSGRQCFS